MAYTFEELLHNHLRSRGIAVAEPPEDFTHQNRSTLHETLWWLINQGRQHPGYARQEVDLRFLEFFGFALGRVASSQAQLCQDLWVLWELRQKREGYFVEFGGADGIACSNTYLLEKGYGWRGIVAEPNPLWRDALPRNRSCAVSSKCVYVESGRTLPFKCCDIGELSTLAVIDPADFFAKERQTYREIAVETISLTDLLATHGAPSFVDYLSIDTEGSELDILRAHDFARYRFGLITVEHNGTGRREAIHDLLRGQGYERVFAGYTLFDDWYLSSDLPRR